MNVGTEESNSPAHGKVAIIEIKRTLGLRLVSPPGGQFEVGLGEAGHGALRHDVSRHCRRENS